MSVAVRRPQACSWPGSRARLPQPGGRGLCTPLLPTVFPSRSAPFLWPPFLLSLSCLRVGTGHDCGGSPAPHPPAPLACVQPRCQLQPRPGAVQSCLDSFTAVSQSSVVPCWPWVCRVHLARAAGPACLSWWPHFATAQSGPGTALWWEVNKARSCCSEQACPTAGGKTCQSKTRNGILEIHKD